MRLCLFLFAVSGLWAVTACNQPESASTTQDNTPAESRTVGKVNPVIGNESFVAMHGHQPTPATPEQQRIRTHLRYVEQQLRAKDVSHLAPQLRERRQQMLDLLRQYRQNGRFPHNNTSAKRTPCFIDEQGNICAVGYLVAQTAGRKVAEALNQQFQYDRIYEMTAPALKAWVQQSGLTLKECAMIQPAYGRRTGNLIGHTGNTIDATEGVASGLLTGGNLALSALNLSQFSSQRSSNELPYAGLALGAGQLILGVTQYPDNAKRDTERLERLAMTNIGVGFGTLLASGFNLTLGDKVIPDENTAVRLHSVPTRDQNVSVGLTLTRQF